MAHVVLCECAQFSLGHLLEFGLTQHIFPIILLSQFFFLVFTLITSLPFLSCRAGRHEGSVRALFGADPSGQKHSSSGSRLLALYGRCDFVCVDLCCVFAVIVANAFAYHVMLSFYVPC